MHCFQKCPLDVIKPFDPLFYDLFSNPWNPNSKSFKGSKTNPETFEGKLTGRKLSLKMMQLLAGK